MPIDPRFIINLKGKDFVLFSGLLAEAHANGLIGIETELQRDLSNPEQQSYVFRAIGRFRSAEGEAIWSAYGDASPSNSQMRGAYLRHAETRAAARMLRMATNVGMCSVEELGPDGQTEDTPNGGSAGTASGVQARHVSAPAAGRSDRSGVDGPARAVGQKERPLVDATAPPRCDWQGCDLELTEEEERGCRLPKYQPVFRECLFCQEHRKRLKEIAAISQDYETDFSAAIGRLADPTT